jgi:signal transduction histidine kinase
MDGDRNPGPPPLSRLRRAARANLGGRSAGSLLVIVLTLALIGVFLDLNLRALDRVVEQATEVEEPTSAAAYEMEINALGTGLGVWKYLTTGDPAHRSRVEKDESDFRKFRAQHRRLSRTAREMELDSLIDALFTRFMALAHSLMDTRDQHQASLARAAGACAQIDEMLDQRMEVLIARDSPGGAAKLLEASAVETDVAEVNAWLAMYASAPTEPNRRQIQESLQEARGHLATLLGLDLTPEERACAQDIAGLLAPTVVEVEQAIALRGSLLRDEADFMAAREELDLLLDEGIQVLARGDLGAVRPKARAAIARMRAANLLVLALGAAVCLSAAGVLAYRSSQLKGANQELRREIERRQEAEAARSTLLCELVSVQEEERGRLARELHDQMGQHLSTILLGLKALARAENGEPHSTGTMSLDGLQELTGRVIDQVHSIAWELRPAALDDLGLEGALGNYVEDWTKRAGVTADFHARLEGRRLPSLLETTLYRAAQEALTNVLKHARAETVSVTLQQRAEEVVLVVEDDGVGFDPESVLSPAAGHRRLGLLGMKERVALVGGALELESAPGRGSTVVVRVPLHRSREPIP